MDSYEVCETCTPLMPVEPEPSDCCGQGCVPCVLDIHQEELTLWKKHCWENHGGGKSQIQEDSAKMSSDEYTSCCLTTVEQLTHSCFRYTFTLPEDHHLDLSIGKHLILRQASANGRTITRQYTPISPPGARKDFTVLIKLYKDGHMSEVIKDWGAGKTVADWRGPIGCFNYRTNQCSHMYLIAAGTGITPMYQIIRSIIENDKEETLVKLLYAARTREETLLREELNGITSYWNFTVKYFLSDESNQNHSYGEIVHYERISKEVIKAEVTNVSSCLAIVCGTREFEGDMRTHVLSVGIPEEQIVRF